MTASSRRHLVYPSPALRISINVALAAISGVLFALAFPNAAIGWLMFIALLPLFVALTRAKKAIEAFLLGWLSQTIAWLIMVPWVVRVMSHYGGFPYITRVALFLGHLADPGTERGPFCPLVLP